MKKSSKIISVISICFLMIISGMIVAVYLDIIQINVPALFSIFQSKEEPELHQEYTDDMDTDTPVKIQRPPSASFEYTIKNYTVYFKDTSSDPDNDTLTYVWSFGDGGISSEQNPVHTYVFNVYMGAYPSVRASLLVDDGRYSNTSREFIEFKPVLEATDYAFTWHRDTSTDEFTKWMGSGYVTLYNKGGWPAEIYNGKFDSSESYKGYSSITGSLWFNFTYTYLKEFDQDSDGSGMTGTVVFMVFSNNTYTLQPGESVTLEMNPELSDLLFRYSHEREFVPGKYKMNINIQLVSPKGVKYYDCYFTDTFYLT